MEHGNPTTAAAGIPCHYTRKGKNMGRRSFLALAALWYREIFAHRETGTKNPAGFTLPDVKNKGSERWEITRFLLCSG